MSIDPHAIDTGLYTALTGSTALTALLSSSTSVYSRLADQSATPPYVVFSPQVPATPMRGLGGGSVLYEDAVYQVKTITDDHSSATAGTIAKRIDAALDNQTLTVTGYTLMRLQRERTIDYIELADGKRLNHLGALYRVQLIPS